MKIRAAVLAEQGAAFQIQTLELGEPRSDEMLVEIAAVGLCHTDLSVASGATPFPLPGVVGHEGAGTVRGVGAAVSQFEVGDHVVISFMSCGTCESCRAGRPVYCTHWIALNLLGGSRLDGSNALSQGSGEMHGHFFGQSSFASHVVVNARAAVKVPVELPLATLAPLACGVQTGAGAILNVAKPSPGSSLVVFGAGGVGLSAIMAAALTPVARIIAVDVNRGRLDLAAELGATHTVDSSHTDPVQAVHELTAGGAHYALETSGRVDVLAQAIDALTSAGTCVVIGAPPLNSKVSVDVPNLLGRGIRIIGTNQGDSSPQDFIPRLIRLHEAGRLPFDRLITQYRFEDINQAADAARSGIAIKPVLLMS